MHAWAYKTASSAIAAIAGAGAVIGVTAIAREHTAFPSPPTVSSRAVTPPARARLTPVVRTPPRPSAPGARTGTRQPVLVAAEEPSLVPSPPTPEPGRTPAPPASSRAPSPSSPPTVPATPSPQPSPEPHASPDCIIGVSLPGVTVCVPAQIGG